jgi:transcriptional regulator with XRE-family HTH domain
MFNIEKMITLALKSPSSKERKITLESLSTDAGMSRQTLSNIFRKDDARLSQLLNIAKVLGVSIYDTFETPGKPEVKVVKELKEMDAVAVELLYDQVDELRDHNQSLKKYIASLERELERYHKDSDQNNSGSSRQTG